MSSCNCNTLLIEFENNYKDSLQKDIKPVSKLKLYDFLQGDRNTFVCIILDNNCLPKYFNLESIFEKKWSNQKKKCIDGVLFITNKNNNEVCCCFFEFKATIDDDVYGQIEEFISNFYDFFQCKVNKDRIFLIYKKDNRSSVKKLKLSIPQKIKSDSIINYSEICK
jgi:hypothetical protein